MRPRFSKWQVSPVFMPSLKSGWMGLSFTKCTGLKTFARGKLRALHEAAVFKLAGSPGFHAVADICLDGAVLYQVHGTKNRCPWDTSLSPHSF